MVTLLPKQSVLGDNTILGPIHDAHSTSRWIRRRSADRFMEQQRVTIIGSHQPVWTGMLLNFRHSANKQFMYPEAVAPHNESSGTEQSVADMEPRTPIFEAPPERPAEPTSPSLKNTAASSHRKSQDYCFKSMDLNLHRYQGGEAPCLNRHRKQFQ